MWRRLDPVRRLDHWRRLDPVGTVSGSLVTVDPVRRTMDSLILDKFCTSLCLWSSLSGTLRLSNALILDKSLGQTQSTAQAYPGDKRDGDAAYRVKANDRVNGLVPG